MRRLALAATATLALAALSACDSAGNLTPTGKLGVQIGCAVDGIGQPILLPLVAGVPTVGGIAATLDQALVHPLVIAECAKLNGKPVVASAAP